jgi:Uma2 family endonuclease
MEVHMPRPAGLLTPEEETYPNRYRWSVEACYRLRDLGFLDGKFEVLDGEVVNKMGQKPPHRMAIILLAKWLGEAYGPLSVQTEGPIALEQPDSVYSEPEPDLAVTREPTTAYALRHPGPADVLLVVEVSDTTLRTDLLVKARLYARAGIGEYWALDLHGRCLHVHRDPSEGEYQSIEVVAEQSSVSPAGRPDASLQVGSLLAPQS